MQHSLYSDIFYLGAAEIFFSTRFLLGAKSKWSGWESCGVWWLLLDFGNTVSKSCEHSLCCFSALCEVKILWFSLVLNRGSTGSSGALTKVLFCIELLNPEFFLTSPPSYSLKYLANYIVHHEFERFWSNWGWRKELNQQINGTVGGLYSCVCSQCKGLRQQVWLSLYTPQNFVQELLHVWVNWFKVCWSMI